MRNRRVYIVIGFHHPSNVTYVSEVCSSRKKADATVKYLQKLMADDDRSYWVYDARMI